MFVVWLADSLTLQIFTAAFFICALVVASVANAGFDVVLTGLLLCAWEVGAMWLLKRGPHETSVRGNKRTNKMGGLKHKMMFFFCYLRISAMILQVGADTPPPPSSGTPKNNSTIFKTKKKEKKAETSV